MGWKITNGILLSESEHISSEGHLLASRDSPDCAAECDCVRRVNKPVNLLSKVNTVCYRILLRDELTVDQTM